MVDPPAKKQNKGVVTEEDVSTLLQRYPATTVLALLRELAQLSGVKIDWRALVKNTSTGIKNAREYQMIWRHLAYGHPLIENVEEGAQPLDDDSDLEYELEAFPPVSAEVAMEASNCVKVLASVSANESCMPNNSTVEGDIPNAQKQLQAASIIGEGLDANGSTNNNRRKRKPWSNKEELELIAAVEKFGEGNWAAIVKGEFNGERTTSQLSQRWAIIKRRQESRNIGASGTCSQLSEAQLATRRAIDIALKGNLTAVGNGAAVTSNPAKITTSNGNSPVTDNSAPPSQPLPSQVTSTSVNPAPISSLPKPRPPLKKAPPKPSVSAESIQAAAVAAGARIASPSDAASLFKAVKDTVHIRGGSSLMKPSAAGTAGPLPPNVHFIRTGLAPAPTSVAAGTSTFVAGGQHAKGNTVRPSVSPAVPKAKTTPAVAMEGSDAAQQMEDKTSTIAIIQGSDMKPMGEVQEDSAYPQCLGQTPSETGPSTSASADVGLTMQTDSVGNSQCTKSKGATESECKDEASKPAIEIPVPKDGNEDLSAEKMDVSNEGLVGAEMSDPMDSE